MHTPITHLHTMDMLYIERVVEIMVIALKQRSVIMT